MATIAPLIVGTGDIKTVKFRWLGMANGDDGASMDLPAFADKSVQVTGVFGVGGELSIQGSNDGGVTWHTLTDPLGRPLTFTAGDIQNVTEVSEKIRPIVTGGDGTTLLNVYFFAKKAV